MTGSAIVTPPATASGRRIVVRNPEMGKWDGRVIADTRKDGRSPARYAAQVWSAPAMAGNAPDGMPGMFATPKTAKERVKKSDASHYDGRNTKEMAP